MDCNPVEGGSIKAVHSLEEVPSSAHSGHQLDTNNNTIESKDDGPMKNESHKPNGEQRNREPDADTIKMYGVLITFNS